MILDSWGSTMDLQRTQRDEMAIHDDLRSMSKEAVDEYLAIAGHCVSTEKPTGGVYGYAAVLLLFSLVDAFSNNAGYPAHSFGVLKDIFPCLNDKQVKNLAKWFRHPSSHHAVIMPGTQLSISAGTAIEVNALSEPTHIRLKQFYEAVEGYWKGLGPDGIKPTFIAEASPRMEIYGSVSAPTVTGEVSVKSSYVKSKK
jgi:hypothetical protein